MSDTAHNAADITRILDQEINALEAVLNVLESEHHALEARDAEALTAASELKLKCIETARRIGADRAALITDTDDIQNNPQVSLRWERLAKLAHGCKEKNERNGMMIRWQHKYVEQTLAVLRNDSGDSALYGPDGNSSRGNKGRGALGSA